MGRFGKGGGRHLTILKRFENGKLAHPLGLFTEKEGWEKEFNLLKTIFRS
jgi:hypothetical protein